MQPNRQVIVDIESTGMPVIDGHEIVEFGAIAIVDRKPVEALQIYITPSREVDPGALEVHGLTRDDLISYSRNTPVRHTLDASGAILTSSHVGAPDHDGGRDFSDVAEIILDFLGEDEIVAHNAGFDTGFLNEELRRRRMPMLANGYGLDSSVIQGLKEGGYPMRSNRVLDTVELARNRLPAGSRVDLNTLCRRFGIDTSERALHGALLDAFLLYEVFIGLTRQQQGLSLGDATAPVLRHAFSTGDQNPDHPKLARQPGAIPVIQPDEAESDEHNRLRERLRGKASRIGWDHSP